MAYKFDPVRWLRRNTTGSGVAGWFADQGAAIADWWGPGTRAIRNYITGVDIGKATAFAVVVLTALQGILATAPSWVTVPIGLTNGVTVALATIAWVAEMVRRYRQGVDLVVSAPRRDPERTVTVSSPPDRPMVVVPPDTQPVQAGPPVVIPAAPDQPAVVIPAAEPAPRPDMPAPAAFEDFLARKEDKAHGRP